MLFAVSLLLKALAVPLLARIAWVDFVTQKIANREVLLLLCLGLGSLQLVSVASGSWWDMGLSAIAGLVLFVALFPFWIIRKVGAGDVKLMGASPEYYNNVGYSFLLRGKLQDARSNFLKAYELAPNDPTVANNLKLLSSSVQNIER